MIGYLAAFASGALVVFAVVLAWCMCRVASDADKAAKQAVREEARWLRRDQ